MAFTVLQIVAPVFLLAAIGFAWVRLGYDYDTVFVTRLAMTLAIPCLIFVALAGGEVEADAAGRLAMAALAAYAGILAAFGAICLALGLDRRTYWAPLVFGNTGNLGLPLALLAFGQAGLGYAVVVFSVSAILQFTVGLMIVAGSASPARALREPMVAATLLGALFLWRDWSVPAVAFEALTLVGQMGIPLMLITLGVAVARIRPAAFLPVAGLSLVKVAVCTGLALVTASAFALDEVTTAVLTVQLATPVAVTSYLLALKYGAKAEPVAGMVVVSTILSIGTLPLILAFFV
nr:AEC family transporter [Jannaschia sp. S6380]